MRAVMSRVSVVAGATIDGDLGDSNLGCTWAEFGSVFTLPMYESYVPVAMLRSLLDRYLYSPPRRSCMT